MATVPRKPRYTPAMLDFSAERDAVPPKDASTVVVVRDAADGPEVFCVERHVRSGFLGGAVVFPGGKLADGDRSERWQRLTTPLSARSRSLAADESAARAFAVAALRELLEEAALLPVVGAHVDSERALSLRAELAERGRATDESNAFADLLEAHDLVLDTARLEGLARWVTPVAESRRYDTRFYLLSLDEEQAGAHDAHETTQSFWATPRRVLARWEADEIFLAPPTSSTLTTLAAARDVSHALELARAHSQEPICPYFVMDGEQAILALPGDPLYPERHEVTADAPTRFVMRDGRFVAERAP